MVISDMFLLLSRVSFDFRFSRSLQSEEATTTKKKVLRMHKRRNRRSKGTPTKTRQNPGEGAALSHDSGERACTPQDLRPGAVPMPPLRSGPGRDVVGANPTTSPGAGDEASVVEAEAVVSGDDTERIRELELQVGQLRDEAQQREAQQASAPVATVVSSIPEKGSGRQKRRLKLLIALILVVAIAVGVAVPVSRRGGGGGAGGDSGGADANAQNTKSSATLAPSRSGPPSDGPDATPALSATPSNAPTASSAPSAPPSGAPGYPRWGPHTRFGHEDTANEVSNSNPKIAMAPNGDAYMTFYDQGTVWARRYVATTKTWDALKLVSDGASSGVNSLIDVDNSGNAIVAWKGTSGNRAIFARKFTSGLGWAAGWGIVETVATFPTGTQQYIAGLSMTGEGHACVGWRTWIPSTGTYETFFRLWEEGKGWDVVRKASGSSTKASTGGDCAIATIGNNLRVVSAFSERVGTPLSVFGVIYNYSLSTHTGSLVAPVPIETEGTLDVLLGQVSIDAAGNCFVAMIQRDEYGKKGTILINRYTGAWSGATAINPTVGATFQKLRVHPNGDAWVVWRQTSPTAVWGRLYSAGTWQSAAKISVDDNFAGPPSVDMDLSGNGLAVWGSRVAGVSSIFANEYSANGGWGTPHLLEDDLDITHEGSPVVGFENGIGVAAWTRRVETPVRRGKIFGAIYQ